HPGTGGAGRRASGDVGGHGGPPHLELTQALEAFTQQLVTAGAQLMRERRGLAKVLDTEFTRLYGELAPRDGESAALRYLSAVELEPDARIESAFRATL